MTTWPLTYIIVYRQLSMKPQLKMVTQMRPKFRVDNVFILLDFRVKFSLNCSWESPLQVSLISYFHIFLNFWVIDPLLKIVISKMLNVLASPKTPQHMRQNPRLYAGVTTMLSPFNRFAFWPVHFCVQGNWIYLIIIKTIVRKLLKFK